MTRVEEAVEVNVPAHTAYDRWMQFEQFPRFMEGVREVRRIDDAHLHWVADCDGRKMEWDTELTGQLPDRMVSWRSTSGAANTGTVRFMPVDAGHTRIELEMMSESERDGHGTPEDLHMLSGRVRQDMQRFKSMIEQGEAEAATTASAHGQESHSQRTQALHAGGAWLPHLSSMWEEPFSMMRRMSVEMDRMVERFIGRAPAFSGASDLPLWTPAIEISQHGDQLLVSADLPGMSKEDVKVEVRGDKLVIAGQRHDTVQNGDPAARHSARNFGRFYRMIALPSGTSAEQAQASMQDGVLQIRIPIADVQTRARTIEVQQGRLSGDMASGETHGTGPEMQSGMENTRESPPAVPGGQSLH